jgi:hypothetical protein
VRAPLLGSRSGGQEELEEGQGAEGRQQPPQLGWVSWLSPLTRCLPPPLCPSSTSRSRCVAGWAGVEVPGIGSHFCFAAVPM